MAHLDFSPNQKLFEILYCYAKVGLTLLIRRSGNMSPTMKMIVQKFVPFPAVGTFQQYKISHWNLENYKNLQQILSDDGGG